MKERILILLSLLLVLSLALGACSPAAPAPADVAEPEVAEEAESAEEPAAEEAALAGPDEFDAAYGPMLSNMTAYNTVKMDALAEELLDTPPFLIDVRTDDEVSENGHIPGAIHIPLNELGQHLDLLPSFKTPIVTYCAGGWRATIAMTQLAAAGWSDVRALKARFSDWVEAGYAVDPGFPPEAESLNTANPDPSFVEAFDRMLSNREGWGGISADDLNIALGEDPDRILIDVRRVEELEANGVIDAPNLVEIPVEDFVAQRDAWPTDLDAPITVYCGSGHRSTIAASIMWTYGYTNVTSLQGGFGGWKDAGYATIGGAANPDQLFASMLVEMEGYNTVKADTLAVELLEEPPPYLLDVRTAGELEESGHIPGAVHIPLNELGDNLDLLPSFDTPIVTYCGSGWRATIAMTYLSAAGWEDVRALKTTFADWDADGYAIEPGLAAEPIVLNVANPDPTFWSLIDDTLAGREGWGVITADDLNLALVENPELVLIDVRRTEELQEKGLIEGAVHIPLETFIDGMADWPADKDSSVVVYCGSGHRSTMGMAILWAYGYTNVQSLKGGFGGWIEAGYPSVEYVMQ
jgi:rhodanese-related sulfurtransferase